MFKAKITVTLRSSILDPQGKAVEHGLHSLGYQSVSHVRIGKHIELSVGVDSKAEAERIVREACERLLSNPVMEDFSFTLEPLKKPAHVKG
ncbi:MAG: phosphoribosylformylglycinamidine synthase subunit PurS [Ignavibacteriales bacterium]|nr:phosphoribosylformylglycinamidine synthase subunit PurS [Ignavibacteriales bacterium]